MNNGYKIMSGLIIIIITGFLFSYYGYWYLQVIPAIAIGYFLLRKLWYILAAGVLSIAGLFISFIPSYGIKMKGALLSAEISGIPYYLLTVLTLVIMFVITVGGLILGSSFVLPQKAYREENRSK
ncbi:MAG: hypothetical protein RE471_06370 [Ferroplasma sp.]|uniref:hypothetical protein n=1 Tax=Ferroplasma sp. TaxID=2591003 RepID=UPI0028152E49|nr:hypothetical protein [Ferroplasma sp.]WMT50604.1 MAG: hypothetical protein RE471_06370 [Ferroplasma sp.]